ncbi:MAG: hypothetical protein JST89_24305 [Cyanobacteria bacterium SZAS-4]|nr:hypothetical protein [Cyanobacteria bacterium SZAS-4]
MSASLPSALMIESGVLFLSCVFSLLFSLRTRGTGLPQSAVSVLMGVLSAIPTTAIAGALFPVLSPTHVQVMLILNMLIAGGLASVLFYREWQRVHQLRAHVSEIITFLLSQCFSSEEPLVTRQDLVALRDAPDHAHRYTLIELCLENMDVLGHRAPVGVFLDDALYESGDFWSRSRRFLFESNDFYIIERSDLSEIRHRIARL